MKDRIPWTREELRAMLPRVEEKLDEAEACFAPGAVRPLSPMTVSEARELILSQIHLSTSRILTAEESHLAGELLAVFEMAVRAEMLGKRGRYFVVSEDQIDGMMRSLLPGPGRDG